MHQEDPQQPSLTRGDWLLKTAVNQPLHKICSTSPGNHFWWAIELRDDGGELEEGVILCRRHPSYQSSALFPHIWLPTGS